VCQRKSSSARDGVREVDCSFAQKGGIVGRAESITVHEFRNGQRIVAVTMFESRRAPQSAHQAGSEIETGSIETHFQHRGSGPNVYTRQIAKVRNQRVRESKAKATLVGGITKKKEREHSDGAMMVPRLGASRHRRCIWEIRVGITVSMTRTDPMNW
jgi:hypothetical protein